MCVCVCVCVRACVRVRISALPHNKTVTVIMNACVLKGDMIQQRISFLLSKSFINNYISYHVISR